MLGGYIWLGLRYTMEMAETLVGERGGWKRMVPVRKSDQWLICFTLHLDIRIMCRNEDLKLDGWMALQVPCEVILYFSGFLLYRNVGNECENSEEW